MITVLMDNRQPAKALAWLMVLAFVPVIGIALYIFFGQNIRKDRRIDRKSLEDLQRRSMLSFVGNDEIMTVEQHKELISLFSHQVWALPFKNNKVEIFTSGREFFPFFFDIIRQAKHHIHLLTYIIEDDELGNKLSDILIEKANNGVEVRLVYDDVGCWKVNSFFFKKMTDAGVEVYPFMPVHFPMLTSKVNYRNHRKICVIDGQHAFIGGMNIAQRYITGTKRFAWRDTHLYVQGNVVYGIQSLFLSDWYFVSRELVASKEYFPKNTSNIDNACLAQVVTSSPTSTWPDIMQGYVKIILNAKQYVYIETPYFMPTEPVSFALRTAALSGVDVRLMIPYHSDARFPEWASRSFILQALDAGVKIYVYRKAFNHSKILISDDTICSCGSTNVDFRSFENNFEANLFFYNNDVALKMKEVFLEDIKHCILYNDIRQVNNRPFFHRLWESVVRLLAPLL